MKNVLLVMAVILVAGCVGSAPDTSMPTDVTTTTIVSSDSTEQSISESEQTSDDLDESETEDIDSDLDEILETL